MYLDSKVMANPKLSLVNMPSGTSNSNLLAQQRLDVSTVKSEPQVMIKREPQVNPANNISSASTNPSTGSVEEWNIRVPRAMARRYSVLKLPAMGTEWNTPRQVLCFSIFPRTIIVQKNQTQN